MEFLDIKPYPTGLQVSRNHTLLEFIYDSRAVKDKFYMQFVNQPAIVENIRYLCETLIDPLEHRLGMEFEIISGYRCRGLDTIVAEKRSQMHLCGLAVDIRYFPGLPDLIDLVFHLPFHELFLFDDHIHLSIKQQFKEGRMVDYRVK